MASISPPSARTSTVAVPTRRVLAPPLPTDRPRAAPRPAVVQALGSKAASWKQGAPSNRADVSPFFSSPVAVNVDDVIQRAGALSFGGISTATLSRALSAVNVLPSLPVNRSIHDARIERAPVAP